MRQGWIGIASIVLLSITMAGCGDDPQQLYEEAEIAMANGRPELAVEKLQAVLKKKPDHANAMALRARANMQLDQLAVARKDIDALLALAPGKPGGHTLRGQWAMQTIEALMDEPLGEETDEFIKSFDEAVAIAREEATWFIDRDEEVNEGQFLLARIDEMQALRIDGILKRRANPLIKKPQEQKPETENAEPALTSLPDQELETLRDEHFNNALLHLEKVIASAQPHAQAEVMYNRLLLQGMQWQTMWDWMQKMAGRKDSPASVTHSLVIALLVMPSDVHPLEDRVALAAEIHNSTAGDQHDSIYYMMAGARIDMAKSEWDKALATLQRVQTEAASRFQDNLQARYLLSLCYFNTRQYDKAEEMLRVLVGLMPDAPEVQSLLGQVMLRRGNLSGAKTALDRAIRDMSNEPATKQAWMMASAQSGDFTQVTAAIEAYYKEKPDDILAIALKARLERSRGNLKEVAALLEKVENSENLTITHVGELLDGYRFLGQLDKVEHYAAVMREMNPDSARGQVVLVEALLSQNRIDEARRLLTELQKTNADDPAVQLLAANIMLRDQAYADAERVLGELVAHDPRSDDLRVMRAQSLVGIGRTSDAISLLENVLADSPWNTPARAMTIRLYQSQRNAEKVAEHLHQIDRSRLNEQDNPALAAQVAISDGKMNDAASILSRAIDRGEQDPLLPVLLAMVRQRQGKIDEAETLLLSAIEKYPSNGIGYQLYARFMLQQNKAEEGMKKLETFAGNNPPVVRLMQGALLTSMDQHEQAIEKVEPILASQIKTKGDYALSTAEFISRSWLAMNKQDEAIAVYDRLINADVDAADARRAQIQALISLGRDGDAANKLASMAKTIDAENPEESESLINLYIMLNDYAAAVNRLDQLLAANPEELRYIKLKAGLLRRIDRLPEAESAYQLVLSQDPNDTVAIQGLAQVYVLRGEYPRAESLLLQMARIGRDAEMISIASRGRLYLELGLRDKARSMYQQLERMSPPRNPVLLVSFAQAYYELGALDTATDRLNDIESFAPQYATAQMMLAQIELRQNKADAAGKRLRQLMDQSDVILAIMPLMLQVDIRDAAAFDLVRWYDDNIILDDLPEDDQYNWASRRVEIYLLRENWAAAYDAAKDLSRIAPDVQDNLELELALAIQMNDDARAREIYQGSSALQGSPIGPLAAAAMGLPTGEAVDTTNFIKFLLAMSHGDVTTARALAKDLPSHPTLFASDLLASLDEPQADDELHRAAYRKLAHAQFAWSADAPELAVAIVREVVKDRPKVAAAWALLALWSPDSVKDSPVMPQGVAQMMQAMRDRAAGNPLDAAKQYKAILETEKNNDFVQFELAKAFEHTEEFDRAIEIHERLWLSGGPMKFSSGNDVAYLIAEHQPQRMDEAAAIARAVLEQTNPGPGQAPLLDTVGWIELKLGNKDAALKHLNEAVITLGGIPDVHLHVAEAYSAVGERQWAQYHRDQGRRMQEAQAAARPVRN